MAGPATTGNTFVFNSMPASLLRLPATATIKPGEEVKVRMELSMHAGMDGPHLFRLRASLAGEEGESHPPLELYLRGLFG
ncbi:MAG TPA: hypothetical protein VI729_05895 [Anaerolineales bacterium]|nr:hypothetical protein [Dehalococcoidia bacterium]HLE04128.1 hypothetical protein [Anaerolineales bacterium]